nr:MAG TPA: hypothetical protein [Caudoviricetes sp.]
MLHLEQTLKYNSKKERRFNALFGFNIFIFSSIAVRINSLRLLYPSFFANLSI